MAWQSRLLPVILGGLLLAAAATVFSIQPPAPAARPGTSARAAAATTSASRESLGTVRLPNDRLGVLLLYSLLRSRAAP